MANLDSQGEIVLIELPNPEETQIWEGENESIRPRQHLILQLPVVIAFFIWQARIGSYGNGLIDVEEKPHILKRFWQRRSETAEWGRDFNLCINTLYFEPLLENSSIKRASMYHAASP